MANPIRTTGCIAPDKRDSKPGLFPAVLRAIIYAIIGVIVAGLVSWPIGGFVGLGFLLGGIDSFIDWWLNRRLLCLGGERCAIGVVWSVEPPGEKEGFEVFDNDFSLNLLLSPANPGDGPDQFPTQKVLVAEHNDILQQGLPTFGYEVVAARIKDGKTCPTVVGPMGVVDLGGVRDAVVSLALDPDPDAAVNAALNDGPPAVRATSWANFAPLGARSIKNDGIWGPPPGKKATVADVTTTSAPSTQMLHCEFEGTDIQNLRGVMFWGGLIAGAALVAAMPALVALGPLAVAAGVALFFLFMLLLALFNLAHSHDGSPADSADDPLSGNPSPIPPEALDSCQKWDQTFNLIGVIGRWVYDFGHTRGWNEIHPVLYVQLLATEKTETDRTTLPVDPKDPSKGTLRATRPKFDVKNADPDAETKALLQLWCQEVAKARDPDFKDSQPDGLIDLHPQVYDNAIK
jgi:hypothetical protein